MVWWWWIVPALVALLGAVVLFAGLGRLFRGRLITGFLGGALGGGAIAAAAIASLLALNVQTYARLTHERPVARLTMVQKGPQLFDITVTQPPLLDGGAERSAVYSVNGDEWRIEAQVLKWKPWANVLGLDAQYRLDRLSGRYQSIAQELNAERSVHPLSGGQTGPDWLPWTISAWDTAREYRRYVDAVDTLYGGAAYMPMANGAAYEVWITQSGLIARPANDIARDASAGGWMKVD